MSEEKEDPYNWAQIVRNNRKKIDELEKKLDHIEEYYIEEGIGERLEIIEQELTTFQTKYPYTTAHDNSRELAELRDDFNKLKQLIPMEWQQKENTKQIGELKEQFNKREEQQFMDYDVLKKLKENHRKEILNLMNVEEVLREIVSAFEMEHMVDTGLLSKLTGNSKKKLKPHELTDRAIKEQMRNKLGGDSIMDLRGWEHENERDKQIKAMDRMIIKDLGGDSDEGCPHEDECKRQDEIFKKGGEQSGSESKMTSVANDKREQGSPDDSRPPNSDKLTLVEQEISERFTEKPTENIKVWEVNPEKLKDVQENYVLVSREDLENDFTFLYNKIYRFLRHLEKNLVVNPLKDKNAINTDAIINMIYFYFESRKKKYLGAEKQ